MEKEFKSCNVGFLTENASNNDKKDFKRSRNLTSLENSNTVNYIFDMKKTARENMIMSMQSNIFNTAEV